MGTLRANNNSVTVFSARASLSLLMVIGLLFFVLAAAEWWGSRVVLRDTAVVDSSLAGRVVVDYEVSGDTVLYTYLGKPLPEVLTDRELVFLRSETSYSREVVRDDRTITVETISYPKKTFARDAFGVWHYAEYATTTRDTFLKQSTLRALVHVARSAVVAVAYAVTDTIYSGAGDGSVESILGTWAATHDATSGTAYPTLTSSTVGALHAREEISCDGGAPTYINTFYINRIFLPFDTSSISASATISSASVNVYVFAKTNDDNDGTDFITVVETSQAGHTTLVGGDFDQCGAIDLPTEGVDSGQRKDITSISTSAYLTFSLNSTGLGWIKKNGEDAPCSTTNGISCFGLREGHDTADDPVATPVVGDCEYIETNSTVVIYASEQTGTSQDPYLSVTYTVASAVFRYNVISID